MEIEPIEQHQLFLTALHSTLATVKDMPNIEILAVVAQFAGQLIAHQDCTTWTVPQLVHGNMAIGNKMAIESLTIGHA